MSRKSQRVGHSKDSPLKWQRFGYHFGVHSGICRGVLGSRRQSWMHPEYIYIDLYAGPGCYSTGEWPDLHGNVGSPIIAIETLKNLGLPHVCYLSDPNCGHQLRKAVEARGLASPSVHITDADCEAAVAALVSEFGSLRETKYYGLIFVDPNAYPDWVSLRRLASLRCFRQTDILVNLNASFHKLCFASRTHPETLRPLEHLLGLGKRYIFFWAPDPSSIHQFTLAHCTNWDRYPEFHNLGFHRFDTAKGRSIVELINYSEVERKSRPRPSGLLPGLKLD